MDNPNPEAETNRKARKASDATPRTYAQTVVSHSMRRKENSLFPGINYKPFADYLSRSGTYDFDATNKRTGTYIPDGYTFASLHDYPLANDRSSNAKEMYNFDCALPGQEALSRQSLNHSPSAQLLFLRGFASPEWLRLIGCSYRIDPEFFRRHLDFIRLKEDHFDLPNLPSVSYNIVTLPLMTIGTRDCRKLSVRRGCGDFIEPERKRAIARMRTYLSQMTKEARVGQSIIRNYLIFDEKYIAIEQQLSICLQQRREGWTGQNSSTSISVYGN